MTAATDRFLKAENSEGYVIGAIVCSPQSFYIAAGCGLTAEHFFADQYRAIFEFVLAKSRTAREWDVITLADLVPKPLSATMMDCAFANTGGNLVTANCEVIIAAHTARKVKAAGLKIAGIAAAGPEALSEAHAELSAISSAEANEIESMGDIIRTVFAGVNQRYEQGQTIFGLQTLFTGLDQKLGGLSPGLTIIGARPSMGKTAFALQLASNVALNINATGAGAAKRRVFFASLEMASEPLGRRLLAQIGGIPAGRLKHPSELTEQDWPKMTAAVTQLKSAPVSVWAKSGVTADQIAGQMRRVAASGNLALCIVDYLQLVRLDSKQETRHALGNACKTLRKASLETGVPVVLLSQLNRASEGKPQMKDLRDSGEIEQDADSIIFLHRESYYKEGGASSSGIAKLIIAKQRDGETGDVDQFWDAPFQRFCEPLPAHYAAEQPEEKQPQRTKYQVTARGKK